MKSIQDTLKITNAMYMISSAKLRKAKKSLEDTEPYFYALQDALARIIRHIPDIQSEYFVEERRKNLEELKTGFIVITADKGLAGAYNHNVLKLAEEKMAKRPNNKLFVLGTLGRHYFRSKNINVAHQFHYTVQNPTIDRARMIAERALEEYRSGELDEIYIVYTSMKNAMNSEAALRKLLPLRKSAFVPDVPKEVLASVKREEIQYTPSPEAVIGQIVPDAMIGYIYGALVEAYCAEQHARMSAMQTATDSGREMLHNLTIEYNRVRQAAITQEITEVCAGAKAQRSGM